jgi:hypothetical protein
MSDSIAPHRGADPDVAVLPSTTRRVSNPRTAVTAWVGVGVAIVAEAIIVFNGPPFVKLTAALLLATTAVGSGVMSHVDSGDNMVQASLVLVISLTGFALLAAILIWVGHWKGGLLLLPAQSGLACVWRLCFGRRRRTVEREETSEHLS